MTIEEIKKAIATPSREIAYMREHHVWLSTHFHEGTPSKDSKHLKGLKDFLLHYVCDSDDKNQKYIRLAKLLEFSQPLASMELVSDIKKELKKALSARDKIVSANLKENAETEGFDEFRKKYVKDTEFMAYRFFDILFERPHNFIVTDIKEKNGKTVHYYHEVDINDVHAFSSHQDGTLEHILFSTRPYGIGEDNENSYYALFTKDVREIYVSEKGNLSLFLSTTHKLGFCPAKKVSEQSFFSGVLSDLNWYVLWKMFIEYAESYASFPIYWVLQEMQDYMSYEKFSQSLPEHIAADQEASSHKWAEQNKDGKSSMVYPGEVFTVSAPRQGENFTEPVGKVGADVQALKYINEKQQQRKDAIFAAMVGYSGESRDREAKNREQVVSELESRKERLLQVAKAMAGMHRFILDSMCLEAFPGPYHSSVVNYGSNFYILNENELITLYAAYKETGVTSELENILSEILEYRYSHDKVKMKVEMLKNDLCPAYLMSFDEAVKMAEMGVLSAQDLFIKLNFADLVKRFERENGNLQGLVVQGDTASQYEAVIKEFKLYYQESISTPLEGQQT